MEKFQSNLLPSIFCNEKVTYECSCGAAKTIDRIYLCRHCHKLKCRDCVSHEVDSQYCQHCLEYIPTIDAKLKKNKCASCFQCPSCSHTLTTRALITQVPNADDPSQTTLKKVFFLLCYFCRWSSRDIAIPDQPVASGGWPELETPHANRIDVLFDHYRMLAQKEKLEKEKKRISPRSAIHLLDKYGITPSLSPKVTATLRAKIPLYGSKSGMSMIDLKSPPESDNFEASIATDEIEPLNSDYYTHEFDIAQTTSLMQSMMQIETQATQPYNLHPVSKMLSVKRSMRCKECDHNLSKPEYNPSSIKFKIQLSAYYHIPELRIKFLSKLKKGETSRIEVTLQNPTPYLLHLSFLPDDPDTQPSNASIELPQCEILLSPKDDTADLEVEQNTQEQFKDDLRYISFRKANKVGVYLNVTPSMAEDDCRVTFRMKHDFLNTVIQTHGGSDRQAQILWITHRVTLRLGNVNQ